MTVTELIREQAVQCAVMFAAGVLVMTLYRIFRNTLAVIRVPHPAAVAGELAFWAGAAAITYNFLYFCAFGDLSFHSAGAFAIGALLWKKYFCDIIDQIYSWLFKKQGK